MSTSSIIIAFCLAGALILILLLVLVHPWPWIRKTTCVNCQKDKTRNRNDKGLAICDNCEEALHTKKLIEEKTKDEKTLGCPVDGSAMHKLVLNGTEIVVDQCPECGGTWLSRDEIHELEEDLGQPGYTGSFSSGMTAGMSSGIVIGMSLGRIG